MRALATLLWLPVLLSACGHSPRPAPEPPLEPLYWPTEPPERVAVEPAAPQPEPTPTPQAAPPPPAPPIGAVVHMRDGQRVALLDPARAREAGLLLLDVGRAWVPTLFRSVPGTPNRYEGRFVALANGRFDDSPEGRRAQQDRYLELYGIPPTPALLRERLDALLEQPCARAAAPIALQRFQFPLHLDEDAEPSGPFAADLVHAIRQRLRCAGHLRAPTDGPFDLPMRRALEELQRRARIYARGGLTRDTIDALRVSDAELERRALVRVLSERLVLDLALLADGSGTGSASDSARAADDAVGRLTRRVETALGLYSVPGLRRFYRSLGEALDRPHQWLAIDPVQLPDYRSPDMELRVEIDRGDIYYDFPYDEETGAPIDQPVEHRPTLTLFTRDAVGEGEVALARMRTTIGGWRVQRHGDVDYFVYKESPTGRAAWSRIESAPVWMPPNGTPPASLVLETRREVAGELVRAVNSNLLGPSYASAYGLVAAYHRRVESASRNGLRLGRDEGIRTHGSSDYTSMWQRASLGCHRLRNHLALRLFTFVLAHQPHRRLGHRPLSYRMPVTLDEFSGVLELQHTGYRFELVRPLPVDVLPGRVLGSARKASGRRIPAAPHLEHGGS